MTARERQMKFRSEIKFGLCCGAFVLLGLSPYICQSVTAKGNQNSIENGVSETEKAIEIGQSEIDCGIYDVVEYSETDEEDVYCVDVEIGSEIERYYFTIPDIPEDMSEVVLAWNGNQNDVTKYSFVTCR